MIAPDAQGHPICGVGERELAVGLLLAGGFRGDRLELDVGARLGCAGRNSLANLF